MSIYGQLLLGGLLLLGGVSTVGAEGDQTRRHDDGVKEIQHSPSVFRGDPQYGAQAYDARQQWLIYGGKKAVDTPRPLLELGRDFLTAGPYESGWPSHFIVYGDLRAPVGSGQIPGGTGVDDQSILVAALQLNLEVDWKLTSATRIHGLVQPFQSNLEGKPTFSRFSSGSTNLDDGLEFVHIFQRCADEGCDALEAVDEFGTLFLEGDLGTSLGLGVDLPFALGKIPMIFQNGVWVEDAFLGGALTFPAKNSKTWDISNFDITFFGGFDGVDSRAAVQDHKLAIMGSNLFMDAGQGYWELGYGFSLDRDAGDIDLSYHSATLAFSRRYFDRVSNSIRLIGNFGQADEVTANGLAILVESSLVSYSPSTLIPYFNLFLGLDRPQALAKATGLLRNTGLAYEVDVLNLVPFMNDDAHDAVGGALGVEYLFNLDQQIVLEAAASFGLCDASADDSCARVGARDEAALTFRHQVPLAKAWLLRTDGILGALDPLDGADVFAGLRIELRRKF